MRKVAVVGAAMHPFGKFADKPLGDMTREVVEAAIEDAGLAWQDIQAISAGSSPNSGWKDTTSRDLAEQQRGELAPPRQGRRIVEVAAVLMPHNGQFKPGNPGGGRPLGSRNRLTEVALQMLGDHAIGASAPPQQSCIFRQ